MTDASSSTFDPWIGTPQQTSRRKAICKIIIGGLDVTNRLDPHLVSVHVLDGAPYECDIELDDRDGRLPIPPIGVNAQVFLGWVTEEVKLVFNGEVNDVEHGFGRKQGGRRMWVHCSGLGLLGDNKSPMQNHWGEGAPPGMEQGTPVPFTSAMGDVASAAGGIATIHPELGSIARDYWSQNNESPLHFMTRHADEMGAWSRVESGNNFVMTKPGDLPSGSPGNTVIAKWNDNLIGWRLHPMAARSSWGGSQQQYFSTLSGAWKTLQKKFGLANPWGESSATFGLPTPAPNSDVAGQHNEGSDAKANVQGGQGRIVINGEPNATWSGRVQLIGARPGVDGTYLIQCAEHMYSRQGFITWLDVFPEAGAEGATSISHGYPQPNETPTAPNEPGGDVVPQEPAGTGGVIGGGGGTGF